VCCILRYTRCNAHAPYCRLWPVRLYNIFPHYLINGTFFGKKSHGTEKVCFDFLYNFIWNIYHSTKNWARYDHKYVLVFMWSACYLCYISMRREFSRQILDNCSDIKFHENPSSGNPSCSMRTEMTNLALAFRNFANAWYGFYNAVCHSMIIAGLPLEIRLQKSASYGPEIGSISDNLNLFCDVKTYINQISQYSDWWWTECLGFNS
jgi:hypothetical protein